MRHTPTQLGFTLIELVVTITITAIVMVFVSMFIAAPLSAYEAQSRRAALVAAPSDAWPRLAADLRAALPNSVRWRRNVNGIYVALEMLEVKAVARYAPPLGPTFTVWGTTAGVFPNTPLPFDSNLQTQPYYLSINTADAYAPAGSMSASGAHIVIDATGAAAGEAFVTVTPMPAFPLNSPRHRVYLVSGPITYLCDESLGTLRRYSNYPISATQMTWDSPNAFSTAGFAGELIARGLTSCNFAASLPVITTSQTVAVRLTSTASNGDSVTLLHSSRAEYVP
jgi:MSHA biogenesis protein MshO